MERNKALKKISGDSVMVEVANQPYPTICKTVGGATYVVRMHFDRANKLKIDDKLLRLMSEDLRQGEV